MHKVGIRRMFLNQIGIWNLEFRFCKESNTGELLKNFRSKQESHQLTQHACDTRSWNQTQASEVKTQVTKSSLVYVSHMPGW